MDGEILDVVTEWSTRSVSDGVAGLYELVDDEFSGAVTDGTAWAFVLNGRVVGVFDGDVHDFEDASLTAYAAPDVSLPLLYAMQARGGEVRGQYYSNDTPLSEIHETLSTGNFVGYVELSENVLSGDYYIVYYGSRSLPVAYVGNSRRLVTGDEAFDLAADEVGIYSVVDADIEVVDLPERPAEMDTAVAVASEGDAGSVDADEEATDGEESTDSASDDADSEAEGVTDEETPDSTDSEFEALGEMSGVDADSSADTEAGDTETATEEAEMESEAAADAEADDETGDAAEDETAPASTPDVAFGDADSTAGDAAAESDAEAADETGSESADDAAAESEPGGAAVESPDIDNLRRELDTAREAKAELEAERDRLASERDELQAEVESLRERVGRLESEIERLEAGDQPERTLDPEEALAGTNLFVRYEDKAAGTLEGAAEGRLSPDELRENLRLDYHTEFEDEGVYVDDQPFETFLRETPEHRFATWLLLSLTTEIRQANAKPEMTKLYDAIERVDRIDLRGAVDVTVDDEGEGGGEATTEAFDVVFRDKMGDPLFVATFDDSRDPTRAAPIRSLVEGARSVSDALPSFAAAFAVTTSFFEADAMETAVDATRGGLFSRSSRKSYVKLSRKAGFHLCLVEARDGDFFLSVPEL
ncbi:DUF7527 domain-containing protein [Haloplanus sp. C73]|uniref:DUF7527 domain-containing protein n=1 Tax=Haloplanus sp. C73 TaxID=3421641 RepID=UPI003EBBCEA2